MTAGATMAGVTISRTVEWQDTDAAGHYHHSTVIRWVEAAETALHERLGLAHLMGVVPRVHYEVDYRDRLYYREPVSITLRVAEVGRTSLTYTFEVAGPRGPAAAGRMTVVHVDRDTGAPTPWPPSVRGLADGAARQAPTTPGTENGAV